MSAIIIPPVVWIDRCNTGVQIIDEQHKKIFNRLNDLGFVLNFPRRSSFKTSDRLIKTILRHFEYEEHLMGKAEYGYILLHKTAHSMFVKKMENIRKRLKEQEKEAAHDLHSLVLMWFLKHIQIEDQLYLPSLRIIPQSLQRIKIPSLAVEKRMTFQERLWNIGNMPIF